MPLVRARKSFDRLREIARGDLRLPRAAGGAAPGLDLDHALARELFESQLWCRVVDVEAHELRARNEGYYTICSAGPDFARDTSLTTLGRGFFRVGFGAGSAK